MIDMIDKALQIAIKAHAGQTDKGGKPYILHPIHLMEDLKQYQDDDLLIIAALHDVIEDSDITLWDLKNEGFSDRIIQAVACLTKSPNHSYNDYLIYLSQNNDARRVKLSDLKHNMDLTRITDKPLTEKDLERIKRYHSAYNYLYNI